MQLRYGSDRSLQSLGLSVQLRRDPFPVMERMMFMVLFRSISLVFRPFLEYVFALETFQVSRLRSQDCSERTYVASCHVKDNCPRSEWEDQ